MVEVIRFDVRANRCRECSRVQVHFLGPITSLHLDNRHTCVNTTINQSIMSTSASTFSSSSSSSSSKIDTGPLLLGSAYLTSQSLIPPSSPSELNASLCLNISLFKNTLKKYRALDDAITTRLNRDQALHRENNNGGNTEEGQRRNCLRIWRDIIGERALHFCCLCVFWRRA